MALSFATDIRSLFRDMDVSEMKSNGPFDLSKYDDVKKHAKRIYERVRDGEMPCDAAWPPDRVAKFKQWLDEGMQP